MGGSLFGSKSKSSSSSKSEQWSKPVVIPMNDYYPQYLQDALKNFFAQDYPTRATINYGGQSFTVPANANMADRMAQYMQIWRPTVAQESYGWSNSTSKNGGGESTGIMSSILGTVGTIVGGIYGGPAGAAGGGAAGGAIGGAFEF